MVIYNTCYLVLQGDIILGLPVKTSAKRSEISLLGRKKPFWLSFTVSCVLCFFLLNRQLAKVALFTLLFLSVLVIFVPEFSFIFQFFLFSTHHFPLQQRLRRHSSASYLAGYELCCQTFLVVLCYCNITVYFHGYYSKFTREQILFLLLTTFFL